MEYNGIPIEVTDAGIFRAKVGGNVLVAPSVAALKKKMDATEKFVPFTAVVPDPPYGVSPREYKRVQVLARKSVRGKWHWVLDNGRSHTQVFADTPASVDALIAKDAIVFRHRKEREEMMERHSREAMEANNRMVVISADAPHRPEPQ